MGYYHLTEEKKSAWQPLFFSHNKQHCYPAFECCCFARDNKKEERSRRPHHHSSHHSICLKRKRVIPLLCLLQKHLIHDTQSPSHPLSVQAHTSISSSWLCRNGSTVSDELCNMYVYYVLHSASVCIMLILSFYSIILQYTETVSVITNDGRNIVVSIYLWICDNQLTHTVCPKYYFTLTHSLTHRVCQLFTHSLTGTAERDGSDDEPDSLWLPRASFLHNNW